MMRAFCGFTVFHVIVDGAAGHTHSERSTGRSVGADRLGKVTGERYKIGEFEEVTQPGSEALRFRRKCRAKTPTLISKRAACTGLASPNKLSYTFPMANAYLLKTEHTEYSFADLRKDKKTVWDGVHNPVALRNLAAMKPGDSLVIYETGDQKSAVGTASVVGVKVTDPKNPQVEIAAGKALAQPVSLAEIKANKLFASSPLVRMGRLSVVPLTSEQLKALTAK